MCLELLEFSPKIAAEIASVVFMPFIDEDGRIRGRTTGISGVPSALESDFRCLRPFREFDQSKMK